ncbi:MAG: hypothetical protein ACKV2T_16285 [Kofleriaceae bacterium]
MTRIAIGTRKGTFFVEKTNGAWRPRLAGHGGMGSNFVARDPFTNTWWAALGHGHWGAKLSRSTDDGATWSDAPQIKYPDNARYLAPPDPTENGVGPGEATLRDATLLKLWYLAFGPAGAMYVGTIPGGLFLSSNGGETFELNRPLWITSHAAAITRRARAARSRTGSGHRRPRASSRRVSTRSSSIRVTPSAS